MASTVTKEKNEGLNLFQAVFIADIPLVLLDSLGAVRASNDAFTRLLGYSSSEAAGEPFEKFCRKDGPFKPFLERLRREGKAALELDLRAKDGIKVPSRASASFSADLFAVYLEDLREKKALEDELRSARDELKRRIDYQEDFREGVFHMLKDLDSSERELEAAYEKLKETQAQLVQSSKMTALGELAAGVAHELNQPLTVIKGLAQTILKNIDEPSATYEKLKLMVDASKKMELVIRHLRIFSRTDSPTLSQIDLNRVIKDAFVIVNELLVNSSIEVNMKLSHVPMVLGSSNRLEQVVINLVTNAKDAMPCGGTIEITTDTVESSGVKFARASFRDTGCGIPEEIIGRIFDPFFTTKEIGKGTGLGLSISYGIIKEHHGDITVESEPGMGTVFHITLPAVNSETPL